MLIDIKSDQYSSDDNDACYEAVASQEEIYLEETEEEVRSILISYKPTRAKLDGTVFPILAQRENVLGRQEPVIEQEFTPRQGRSLDDDLDLAAEELIAGDSDDPPLSKEDVNEMLETNHLSRG